MIKIEEIETYGWGAAIRGMRNPMNSWDKSDSYWGCNIGYCKSCSGYSECASLPDDKKGEMFTIGDNDLKLMKQLSAAGTDHRKFMRMITVTMDITAPLYWWKEYDTYKVGTVANSCSTMHKIHTKEFTMDDFSNEHLLTDYNICINEDYYDGPLVPIDILYNTIQILNKARDKFLETNDKKYWWQMIQLLPSSYNQKRTVQVNYEVLVNIYYSRNWHKLDEWRMFCSTIKDLPFSEIITNNN